MNKLLIAFVIFIIGFAGNAQMNDSVPRVDFISPDGRIDHGELKEEVEEHTYEHFYLRDSSDYWVPILFASEGQESSVKVVLPFVSKGFQFWIDEEVVELPSELLGEDTLLITLPANNEDFELFVTFEGWVYGKMNVIVHPRMHERVTLIPMVPFELPKDSIEKFLNAVYNQANLELKLTIKPVFKAEGFEDDPLSNPSADHDRYTDQMIDIRDQYFENNSEEEKSSYYMFVIPGFNNESLEGYMVQNKAVGFIRNAELERFQVELARELGFGLGALNDVVADTVVSVSKRNLMDSTGGISLTIEQWESIQHNAHSLSFYDDYEDVKAKSGVVAYYFWEEDRKGNINVSEKGFLKSIRRPFKRNQYTVHLNVTNYLFMPFAEVLGYRINALHILGLLMSFFLMLFLRRRLFRILNTPDKRHWIIRFGLRIISFSLFGILFLMSFFLVNKGFKWYEVHEGELHELQSKSIRQCIRLITKNHDNDKISEDELGSELLIKKKRKTVLKKVKRVLYFDHFPDKKGEMVYRMSRSSDTLELSEQGYSAIAESHYFVLNEYDEDKQLVEQKVYNHFGSEITEKLSLKDPAERVLVFVNGYRPTSLGKTFEENFSDIRNNGLEFANSQNLIYDFDRYDYWRPWKEIDLLFQSRINPSETFYADGHFSVSTSNHRSLISFTTLSTVYPHRCANLEKHTCQNVNGEKTVELLNLSPNKEGFSERKLNGRVAGYNLLQSLNEIPNGSENDTLFLVAHSMGFAYSEGMIEVLRGKINFGGFYIVAPENASTGNVDTSEWQEIWQYGSDFTEEIKNAPCLIDGIASQTRVGGLSENDRVFIPNKLDKKKGFFNSHFIGHYTWIFDINEDNRGFIKQR